VPTRADLNSVRCRRPVALRLVRIARAHV